MFRFSQKTRYRIDAVAVAIGFAFLRLIPVDWASALGGFVTRTIGPLLKVSNVARGNLSAAFPEKSRAEIERIVRGVWENLGRTGAEYAHLDRLWDIPPTGPVEGGRIQIDNLQRFLELRDDGKPSIIFTAHCGNWELLPIGAEQHGLPVAVVFRAPNNPFAARLVKKIRRRSMGRLLPSGVLGTAAAAEALERGENLGMLVDQYYGRGIDLPFFGRPARTAPTLARLAQRFNCPVTGAFVERLKGAHFRLHILPPIDIPRTGDDEADAEALMMKVTKAIEDWVRVRPEQWLWLHRRWR